MDYFYTVKNDKDEFAYMNAGILTFDEKMPRRSCVLGDEDEANDWITMAMGKHKDRLHSVDDNIKEAKKELDVERATMSDEDIGYEEEWIADLIQMGKEIKDIQLRVVKVTITEV